MAFTQISITGSFQDASGAAVDGTVTFTPTVPMRNTEEATEATVDKPIVRAIVGGALASGTLAATDDPDTTPTGATYQVDVRINRISGVDTYFIEVPHDGGPLDLSTVPRATTVTPAMASYLTQPDADALYEPLGGGGGGAVTSVNGATGVVVLGAVDVGAQPTDVDLTAIAALAPTNDDLVQRKAGAWTNRTPAQVKTDLALAKADVGLGSVDNVSAASLRDRSTHTGTQSADTVVDGTTNHAFTAADDTKLTGIATGATANSTDATLLARANHTGAQAISTVTGLQTALDGKVGSVDVTTIVTVTQVEYDALTPDPVTLYVVVG